MHRQKGSCGLSKTEYDFMKYFWTLDHPVEFREVVVYCQDCGKDWAKTTIHTYLTHLIDKGVLGYRLQGKRKLYYAQLTEEELRQRFAREFLAQNFEGSVEAFLAALNYQGSAAEE